jgi:hypothetical protein
MSAYAPKPTSLRITAVLNRFRPPLTPRTFYPLCNVRPAWVRPRRDRGHEMSCCPLSALSGHRERPYVVALVIHSGHPSTMGLVIRWAIRLLAFRGSTGATPRGNAPEFPDSSVGAKEPVRSPFLSPRETLGTSGLWIKWNYESGVRSSNLFGRAISPIRAIPGQVATAGNLCLRHPAT